MKDHASAAGMETDAIKDAPSIYNYSFKPLIIVPHQYEQPLQKRRRETVSLKTA
jgi:hypothetical protein